jgi:hypothetical protein
MKRLSDLAGRGVKDLIAAGNQQTAAIRQAHRQQPAIAGECERAVTSRPGPEVARRRDGSSVARSPDRQRYKTTSVECQQTLARRLYCLAAVGRGEKLAVGGEGEGLDCLRLSSSGCRPGSEHASRGAPSTCHSCAVRMAVELDCDLILIDAPAELLESPVLDAILADAPCDVAALVGGEPRPGPLLVPFVGAEHDWSAIELGAWLADAWQVPLRLAGPSLQGRDASRLLASTSLAVQHAYGVAAEPLLLAPGAEELVRA